VKLNWKKFGRDLKALRADAELGLREVCRETSIDKAAWCRAEAGKAVSVPNYLALCAWMEIHPFKHFWQYSSGHRRAISLQDGDGK
jgi:transcriptional regulator with XRE-family HTH domain